MNALPLAEPIEMSFGMLSRVPVDPKNHVLNGGAEAPTGLREGVLLSESLAHCKT